MKFLQQPIEKKLSALLGAKVTFARLSISPLSGKLEAEGMRVEGESADRPLLSVGRIEAKIVVAKALMGQIVVKSLVVERPEVFLMQREDGKLNIPRRPEKISKDGDEEGAKWEFEAESIRIKDGVVRFQRGAQVSVVEEIHAELKCDDRGRIDLAAIELRGKTDLQGWLDFLPPEATANVRVEITLPWRAIFPGRARE